MHDDDKLPRDLMRAVDVLRETPEVRTDWLESIAAHAAADRIAAVQPERHGRRWALHPALAIAAGVACIAIGAAGMYIAVNRQSVRFKSNDLASNAAAANTSAVRFALVAPGAVTVQLVGDFNAWNPAGLPMRRTGDGSTWEVEVGLAPGRYTYAFVVDGRLARDPSAAQASGDDFGVPNSVLLVKGGGS